MQTDYLIVGQGLAGSLLALELIQRNCKVVIIDNGDENASQVAAGIINPITGLRFVKSVEIENLLPAAKACYDQLSCYFKSTFYIEKPMLRIFRSEAEAKACLYRRNNPDYHAYISTTSLPNQSPKAVKTPFGGIFQQQTGYLLTTHLLNYLKDFFIANGYYRGENFNYADLKTHPVLQWQSLVPKRVIFCEGYQMINNPWFSWLPLRPVKGEILTLQSSTKVPDHLLNYGNWLLPLDNQQFRIGATFERENINTWPTKQGQSTLIDNLKSISSNLAAATITRQQANIRPCTADRQPFIGHHPQISQLSIFNGFGAKGSLQIPWFSQQFANALLTGTPLTKSCNIKRYYASHF
ncbi:MAG: FAD-binding oxidoreductase [Methylococcaceae bacterium]|nr:FAD-binding oxidoreductase [Methylococcaceae bacterium]